MRSNPRIRWVAGYEETSAPWVDSTLLDVCFLEHLLLPSWRGPAGTPKKLSQVLEFAVGKVNDKMGRLADDMKCHAWARTQHTGAIADLRSLVRTR